MSVKEPIKVFIVDDSAVVRQEMEEILSRDPDIRVIGTAADPYIAARKLEKDTPDVITLDVEMPRMDGITFLRKIMSQHPVPVVMCSSLTEAGQGTTLKALEYGAVDIISKPKLGVKQFLEESRILICDAVKAAARAKLKPAVPGKPPAPKATPAPVLRATKKLTADEILPPPGKGIAMVKTTEKVIVVGASTGGTEAIRVFLQSMPFDAPGIVIVQHMPENFTRAFAERLNGICDIEVKEAMDGDTVHRGRALIGPGNRHMLLKRSGARYYVQIKDGPLVSRHRPSVDVLFRSAARYAGANTVGVIMTGMGDDGATGMKEMKDTGSFNFAQDEASCVVFGMPNEAIRKGGVDRVLPLDALAMAALREANR